MVSQRHRFQIEALLLVEVYDGFNSSYVPINPPTYAHSHNHAHSCTLKNTEKQAMKFPDPDRSQVIR